MTVSIWSNGLGADVRSGSLKLEVFEHGGVCRVVPDKSALLGTHATHYAKVPATGNLEEMARLAVALWKGDRKAWTVCV